MDFFVEKGNVGWIEVVSGPMFCGKSEELIRRLRRAQIARMNVLAFKPRIDDRYSKEHIASHSQQLIAARLVDSAAEILAIVEAEPEIQVVGIDEAQFLGNDLVPVCHKLVARGIRVILAALDMDYRGVPWPPIPELLSLAEFADKMKAICMVCGAPASRTQRLRGGGELIVIGSTDSYEARCRIHHTVDDTEQTALEL
jgi:thymidine kinase